MKYLGAVDSEGGPLLLADGNTARAWRGTDEGGSDYERACEMFEHADIPGGSIAVASGEAILWETQGAGTTDVFVAAPGHLVLVRAWLDDPDDVGSVTALAALQPKDTVWLGQLDVKSGVLTILWAPESGECIGTLDVVDSERPTGEMATETAGLLVRLPEGEYLCEHDEVRLSDGQEARRCHLTRRG